MLPSNAQEDRPFERRRFYVMRGTGALLLLTLVATMLWPEGRAVAGVISQQQQFNISAPVVPGSNVTGGGLVLLDRFDASSGTLDAVEVDISGRITLNASLPGNTVDNGAGGLVPSPYGYSFQIEQSLPGFNFLNQPRLTLSEAAVIGPNALVVSYDYTYSFVFDATSDLIGFASIDTSDTLTASRGTASATEPIGANGDRDDFSFPVSGSMISFIPLLELDVILGNGYNGSGGPPSGELSSTGRIAVTYRFTEPVLALSEPASLFALLFGVLAFGFAGRSFRTARTAGV